MSKSSFASLIISGLVGSIGTDGSKFTAATPIQANIAIAQAITTYITGTVSVGIQYSGMTTTTPPVSDISPDTISIIGSCLPPSGTDFNTWIGSIEANIMSGFQIGPGNVGIVPVTPTQIFSIPGLSGYVNQGMLKSAHEGNLKNPQQAVWEIICDGIIKWLEITATLKTYPAKRAGISIGTATILKTIAQ